MSFKDHFSNQAAVYAQSRPTYPAALYAELARLAPSRGLAWDCGTGNGQAAVALAEHFRQVIATEPSAAQLAKALPHARVVYRQSAELAPAVCDGTVDLVTAAQAAHWFDRPKFYAEAKRVLRPGGIIALWSYWLGRVTPEIDRIVDRFHHETTGPCWPPERRHVENRYGDFDFPFAELPFPALAITREWTAGEMSAFLSSWSAVDRYRRERGEDPMPAVTADLRAAWGGERRIVTWQMFGRLGRTGI
ncbi:MAG: SAM-dependent methyltransferase [Opitutus sp.]|nr:SAM-dependent methyltransferase [Opitutus sp.]